MKEVTITRTRRYAGVSPSDPQFSLVAGSKVELPDEVADSVVNNGDGKYSSKEHKTPVMEAKVIQPESKEDKVPSKSSKSQAKGGKA